VDTGRDVIGADALARALADSYRLRGIGLSPLTLDAHYVESEVGQDVAEGDRSGRWEW